MDNKAVSISSLILLLSLISLLTEVIIYYFVPYHWICVVFAGVASLAISHFSLESSLDYGYSFLHSTFMVTGSLIFSVIVYCIQPNQWIQYDFSMVFLVLTNWLVPFLYNSIQNLMDHGPRFNGYRPFFHRMSILFLVLLLFTIVKQYFLTPIFPPYEELPFGANNFVAFMATGIHIENALRQQLSLTPLWIYTVQLICIGVPIGFFCRIYLDKLFFLFRLFIYIAIPVILEVLQYVTGLGRGHIDDVAFSLIGILIGIIIFHIFNRIYYSVANREFTLSRGHTSRYYY